MAATARGETIRGAPAWLWAAALFLGALVAFWPGQARIPPSDRDEARFAQASRQMLETGDFVDIRFQDDARHKKPAGIYWLQAAAAAVAGGPEAAPIAAYRVPSWIGAAAAAALTAWATAALVGWPAALLAGALLAATPLLGVEARIAKTDAALLAAILTAMGALARLRIAPGRTAMARLFWAAIGAGALLKGPIVLIPVLGALGWSIAAERGLAPLRGLRPLEGVALALLIAAPWYVAITLATDGAFWGASLGEDMLGKVATGREAHGAPPGLYLAIFWGTAWPMAVLAPIGAVWLWRRRATWEGRFLLGWIVPTWLLFELVATKLPHYPLPAYPAIAAAAAAAIFADDPSALPRWAWRILLAVFALPAAAIPLGAALAPVAIEGTVSSGAVALALAAAPLLWLAGRALAERRLARFAAFAAPGALIAQAAVFGFAIPALDTAFPGPRMAEAVEARRCGPGPVVVSGYREPSGVFALGTGTIHAGGEGAAEALAEGRAALAFVERGDAQAFRAELARRGAAVEPLEMIEGFNYSKGDPVSLTLFRLEGACD